MTQSVPVFLRLELLEPGNELIPIDDMRVDLRAYLDLYERCLSARRATDAFLRTPPEDKQVKNALERLHRYLAPVDCEVPFRQTTERLRRRAALFDELRGVLRFAAKPQKDDNEHDLERMQEKLNELVASLKKRRPEREPARPGTRTG